MDQLTVSSDVAFWISEIDTYDRQFGAWEKRAKEIIRRYRDERPNSTKRAVKFNILWSNVQTLHPAIYASPPTPNIDRRFQQDDDLGRYSSLVLERAVSYYVKNDIFDEVMKQTSLDRLLPGRGQAWVRYCPVFTEQKIQVSDDTLAEEYDEELESEDVTVDYVHWKDFGHSWGRTWQEVRAVWRCAYLSRAELVKRFGEEIGNAVPLDSQVKDKDGAPIPDAPKKACIYEIWDKVKKKVVWLSKNSPELLDEKDDPLGLKDFFPCPKPIYATLTNDDLIPSPDYALYQDQAIELDIITARIAAITKALKVAGVYDSSAEGIERLLTEGVENKLIPVKQFAVLGGGKGLDNVVSFFPLEMLIQTLQGLYQAREQVKQVIYEITGISDVIRGATNANETATAQQLKGQYASLRLDNMQKDVARFSRDLVVIMTEVIAKHFSLDTIKQVSGVKLLTEQEKQQIQFQQQNQAQQGQEVPPLPEEIQELMDMPSWENIDELIRNDTARNFRIDIETDSTIKTDQEAEKQARIEFLGAVSGFMQQAVNTPPELQPLVMDLLLFGVRGFKVSRELETAFEATIDKLRKQAEQPQQPQPNPEIEVETLKQKGETERKQMEIQGDKEIEVIKQQGEDKRAGLAAKNVDELEKANLGFETGQAQLSPVEQLTQAITQQTNMINQFMAQSTVQGQQIMQTLNAPKKVVVQRDMQGRMLEAVQVPIPPAGVVN